MTIDLEADYPDLMKPLVYGPVTAYFTLELPDFRQVANINVIAFSGADVFLVRSPNGWDIIGGTLESDETPWQALHREALEEAGLALREPVAFGAWRCHSTDAQPYRPHLPHPDFYRLVALAMAEQVSEPAEAGVEEVRRVSVEAAAALYESSSRPEFADLIRLASRIRGFVY
ncbi:MAG: NUDIX hydrolase [Chloroflexi bacterium]|nr:NUDIX hydrolase [Chloroflexota bacterium]